MKNKHTLTKRWEWMYWAVLASAILYPVLMYWFSRYFASS
ncbi:hypothetical protein M23134_07003 [Microscilla marina ATCC 23134]|uniref:Uncharacterized protein n=1 Tax=Microscilla marina ATCC 23134 TaxID=313606 RepID=A1ZT18_MICM2|nr:hypothetical protein M23134_07003 [Microscilla marina ATCC 23134]